MVKLRVWWKRWRTPKPGSKRWFFALTKEFNEQITEYNERQQRTRERLDETRLRRH